MATEVQKIDSNATGLRYQEELCIGVAEPTNPWLQLEPNTYDDFGGEFTTVARNPINAGRQRQKGVLIDLDASGGFNQDVTQANMQDILQGFFFADLRRKNDVGADRQPRRAGIAGEFADYLMTDIDGSDVITVDSRVAVSIAINVAGTGYADGDIVTVTDGAATIEVKGIVNETGGVPDTITLTDAVFTGGDEGRASADLAGPAATTVAPSGGTGLTVTITYGNGLIWQGAAGEGDILLMAGHDVAANNGEFRVTAVTDNTITVTPSLTLDATIDAAATLTTVGYDGLAGDIDVVNDGGVNLPTLTSTSLDFTTLGLIPGEWIFIGGDLAGAVGEQFLTAVNNGFARIHTIAATVLTLDKTANTMVTEANTAETIKLYFGRVLKNEADATLQVRRT